MRIPSNMTEKEVIKIINKVCKRTAPKYVFYGYTKRDMYQEAYIICIKAMERYDENRPLENFLAANLSNRLKNFIRDNHYNSVSDESRAKICQPAQLENDNTIENWLNIKINWLDDIDREEIMKIINDNIPPSMRFDYLKMRNDVYIPKSRREEIIEEIQEILQLHGYFKEG